MLPRDRLFGIGDNAVQTFDISNRDQPIANAELNVARNVDTVSQHMDPLTDGSERVRYYLDRIDVGNPDQPRVLPAINVPARRRVFDIYDNRLTVVDTTDGRAPAKLTHEMPSWGCGSLEVAEDTAYCAVGQRGVEVIDMTSLRK